MLASIMPGKPSARLMYAFVVIYSCMHLVSCMTVDALRSPDLITGAPQLTFRNGDSLNAGELRLTNTGLRRQPELVADGRRFAIDSVSGFRLSSGKHFFVNGNKPFLQATSGRINVYSNYIFRPEDTLGPVRVTRLSPFDFVQKLPDETLRHLTSGSLLQMTSDNPGAHAMAESFRYHQRRANVTIVAGATLAAAGAVSVSLEDLFPTWTGITVVHIS